MNELQRVIRFVREAWDGDYMTHIYQTRPDGRLWLTRLHGPDGPTVWTLVRPDGSLEDLTR